tara:strand:+ start:80 stop:610 length:531 start_codon:yes stop_codon:yes gene_type:complete
MDVDRVQKINVLAMDLVNQGLAGDKEEAIKQAEQILAKKDYSSLSDQVSEVGMKGSQINTQEKPTELNQEKIQNILQKNTDFIVKRMKEFKGQMVEISSNFEALRGEIDIINGRIKELQMARNSAPQNTSVQPETKPEPPAQQQSSQENKNDHPRSGNFKDDEISIEKFFYSGSKG